MPIEPFGHVDVRPGVDEDGGHGGVVAARRPVQRRLAMLVVAAIVDIGTGVDEQLGRLGPVGEEAGPVGDDVQRRPAPGGAPKTGGRETRLGFDELSQGAEVAGVDRSDQRAGDLSRRHRR